jgi:menaquinone-9 beta-reductase
VCAADEIYDVVVVGGGPGGSAFARTALGLSAAGRTLVIEKARFPRDKVCGDALTYRSIPLVREIFPELASVFPSKSFTDRQLLVYSGGHRLRRLGQQLDVMPRLEFDTALWNTIKGTRIDTLENATVKDVLFEGERVVGVRVVTNRAERDIRSRWLVGADGSRSVVRQKTGPTDRDQIIHAVRQYVRGIDPSVNGLLFFFDVEHNGYFWIFPFARDGERWANVGYGNTFVKVSLKERFRHYCELPEVKRVLGNAEFLGRVVGFPLNLAPMRWNQVRLARPLWGPGYVLVGDAGSLIHPLTGEGISFALQSGKLAAEILYDGRIPEADKGRLYETRMLEYATPLLTSLGAFCAIRVPVVLPRWLSDLYLRSAAWVQAWTGWGVSAH